MTSYAVFEFKVMKTARADGKITKKNAYRFIEYCNPVNNSSLAYVKMYNEVVHKHRQLNVLVIERDKLVLGEPFTAKTRSKKVVKLNPLEEGWQFGVKVEPREWLWEDDSSLF